MDLNKVFTQHDRDMFQLFVEGKCVISAYQGIDQATYLFKYDTKFYRFTKNSHGDELEIIGLSLISNEKYVASIYLAGGAKRIIPFDHYFETEKMTIINDDHKFFYTPEGEFFEWDEGECQKSSLEDILEMMIFMHSQDQLTKVGELGELLEPELRDITWEELKQIQEAEINS